MKEKRELTSSEKRKLEGYCLGLTEKEKIKDIWQDMDDEQVLDDWQYLFLRLISLGGLSLASLVLIANYLNPGIWQILLIVNFALICVWVLLPIAIILYLYYFLIISVNRNMALLPFPLDLRKGDNRLCRNIVGMLSISLVVVLILNGYSATAFLSAVFCLAYYYVTQFIKSEAREALKEIKTIHDNNYTELGYPVPNQK